MRILENIQRQRGLSGDERAALVVGTKLVSALKVWNMLGSSPSSPAKGRRGVRVEDPGVYQTS